MFLVRTRTKNFRFIKNINIYANTKRNTELKKMDDIIEQATENRQKEYDKFRSYFSTIVDSLCENKQQSSSSSFPNISIVSDWCKKMLDYNVPEGKLNRGLSVVISYRILCPTANENEMNQARLLGWCMEMFQTSFLLIDDIMDQSITRRRKPCWYRLPDVGMIACNDAILLECFIYQLLSEHLGKHPCYSNIINMFHKGFRITSIGQCMDVLTEKSLNCNKNHGILMENNFENFNLERYKEIVAHKTAFYSFVLSIRLALYLANFNDENLHLKIEKILMDIGELFQIQDDFLDCFGNPEQMGKIGTDIKDGKCSWLIVRALKLANEQQRLLLIKHYGHENDENLIKDLYRQLNLIQEYQHYHCQTLAKIIENIEQFQQQQQQQQSDKLIPIKLFNEPLTHVLMERDC
ncbi:uncharacterized protein LOC113789422 [Dermatophagoides pteronyssinus]|uniref:uncharacterized protein LOC113789422 n=1 Tax=Dermatophagoides pteronyssinus TaxID=6956 RepID=UPI003F67BF3B